VRDQISLESFVRRNQERIAAARAAFDAQRQLGGPTLVSGDQ
jgi:hypothetical protein